MEEEKKIRKPAVPRQEYQYEVATDLKAISVNNPEMEEKYRKEAEESEESGLYSSIIIISQFIRKIWSSMEF